jgi:phage/plasmid primase-like uncharacterized protein
MNDNKTKLPECWCCGGTGRMSGHTPDGYPGPERCTYCNGTGLRSVEEAKTAQQDKAFWIGQGVEIYDQLP